MYDGLRNEYEQLKRSGGKEKAIIKQPNPYSITVPIPRGFEDPHKTQLAPGLITKNYPTYWLYVQIVFTASAISLFQILFSCPLE
jgi:hypothetical protein